MRTQADRKGALLGLVEEFAEKLCAEQDMRDAIDDWSLTIAETALVFEESLRRSLPVPRKAIQNVS